jgi:septum formation inhibitor MinC
MIQPHQQRVIDEKAELDAKATKLSDFIGNSPTFLTLDPEEQERMKVQNDIMWQYSEILGRRIAAFPKEVSSAE